MSNSIAAENRLFRYQWMFGKAFDLSFFFFPVLIGMAVFLFHEYAAAQSSLFWAILAANAFGAGPFHQGATWFAYFDRKNREHYLSTTRNRIIFFAAPPLVLLATVAGAFYAFHLTLTIWILWSLQHLVQQNVGILLLYHNHGSGEAIVPRPLEVKTQHAAAYLFGSIFFHRVMLKAEFGSVMLPIIAVLLVYTCYLVIKYILELRKQVREGAYLNVPALAFWCFAVLNLWPLAVLGKTFEEAYLIPITAHWFQYIGINYALVKNKYSTDELKNLPIARPYTLFFLLCTAIVFVNLGLGLATASGVTIQPWQSTMIVGIILGLGNVHYFLDAFLWRFREPFQRQAILPYLKPKKV